LEQFSAAVPAPVVIFGLQLLPLSLGRYRLLKRFGCSFVADGEAEASVQDLVLGILICSMRTQEFLGWIESARAAKDLKRFGRRIRREIRHEEGFTVFGKYALFREYLARASAIPPYWEENATGAQSGAHWTVCMENTLRSDLGWTREEIEEAPLSKAIEDYFKRAETLGAVRLMTEWELEQIRLQVAAAAEGPRGNIQHPTAEAARPSIANSQEPIAEPAEGGSTSSKEATCQA
jgi:hypothetical protein